MKKKIFALFSIVFICITLVACGTKTLEEAKADSNAMLEKWDDETYNLFKYIPMESEEGFYNVLLLDASGGNEQMLTKSIVEITVKEVYKELSKCFKGHNIQIGIIVAKDENNILYTYSAEDLAKLE